MVLWRMQSSPSRRLPLLRILPRLWSHQPLPRPHWKCPLARPLAQNPPLILIPSQWASVKKWAILIGLLCVLILLIITSWRFGYLFRFVPWLPWFAVCRYVRGECRRGIFCGSVWMDFWDIKIIFIIHLHYHPYLKLPISYNQIWSPPESKIPQPTPESKIPPQKIKLRRRWYRVSLFPRPYFFWRIFRWGRGDSGVAKGSSGISNIKPQRGWHGRPRTYEKMG